MTKEGKKEIKKAEKRIKELEKLKNSEELLKFITRSELYSIICDYESWIEHIYVREGHT